jgi:hypothetical protein
MAKVQILTEIEIQKLLSQLKTSQLESFLREISALLARRKTKDKKALEARLLQQLNEECVLSEEHWQEFTALKAKREAIKISDAETDQIGTIDPGRGKTPAQTHTDTRGALATAGDLPPSAYPRARHPSP